MLPEFRLFGGPALAASDGSAVRGGAAQSRRIAVLAVLADAWPGVVTRDRVVGLLWPEQDAAGARRLLTQALYELRRELGPVIVGSSRDLAIDPETLRVDLVDFRRALRDDALERAALAYTGPLLAGFHLRGAPEFERWLDEARETARRELQQALEALVARDEDAGRPRDAARWAERVVQVAPYDADAVARAIQLLASAGDPGAALALATAYERRMREDLDLDPAPRVRQLVNALRSAPAPDSATLVVAPANAAMPAVPPIPRAPATPSTTSARELGDSRSFGRVAIVGAAFVIAAIGAVIAGKIRTPPTHARPAARLLTIRAFSVPDGDTATARIARGVASALGASLSGVQRLQISRAASESARDPRALGELRGQLLTTGSHLRIDAELRLADDPTHPVIVTVAGARDSALALAERVAVSIIPALYGDAAGSPSSKTLGRFASAGALRLYLDGEASLRRGAFDSAFDSFRGVTEREPSLAYPWYRRALAAEMAHRSEDADRSIAAADSRAAALDPRERRLVRSYARWRAGDATGAEEILRTMLRADSRDRDAWFHLAEIEYHAGPLHGRPLDDARDAWRRVVALDSGDHSALVHTIRLEARAGDAASGAALLRREPLASSTSPSAAEARILVAYARGTPTSIASVSSELDSLPDYSLGFLQGMVAGLLERPSQAVEIARRLTKPALPQAVQAEGHLALAHLAMARGRWRDASHELDLAARQNQLAAAWSRAYLVTLPFIELPASVRREALAALRNAPTTVTTAPMSLQLAVDVPAAGMIERYLDSQLRLATNESSRGVVTALHCTDSSSVAPSTRALCDDLERGLRAEALRGDGRDAAALRELETLDMLVPYQFAGRSMFFARSRERYLRAVLLERAGRLEEAYAWYAAAPHGSWMDYVFLAPSHLRRGAIRERLGDRVGAAVHYRKVLEVWDQPDSGPASLRREAEAGLGRVDRQRGR